jgi:hypothetical protein
VIYREQYVDHNITYTVSPDPPLAVARRSWGLVQLNVVDELTGRAPEAALRISTTFPRLTPVTAEGVAGFSGVPIDAFPGHQGTAYTVPYLLSADRYITHASDFPVAADAAFPTSFTPPPAQQIALHRAPVVIRGRVYRGGATLVPAAGADVVVTNYWATLPATGAPLPPDIVSLHCPAYLARSVVGFTRSRPLTPVAGQDKELLLQAVPGDLTLQISDRVGLNVGDILALNPADSARIEFVRVTAIQGASTPEQPASLTLAYAPHGSHPRHTLVRRVVPGVVGPSNNLAAATVRGDACLRLASLNGLVNGAAVETDGGGAGPEYHRISLFTAISDAQGFYRLPPLSRAAQLQIDIDDHVNPVVTVRFQPQYEFDQNLLDVHIPV